MYITESEALAEEVITINTKRDRLVKEANQIKERIGIVHQMIWDDAKSPSECEPDYRELRCRYMEIIYQLRQIDPGYIDRFKEKVIARVRGLEARLNAMVDDWDPDDFEEFERLLAAYEKNYDLLEALD